MKKTWLIITLTLSLGLMLTQKSEETLHLQSFFRPQRSLKFQHFSKARAQLSARDQDLLELWESMLTGNTRPLNKIMKEDFARLGLRHLFTPSGLHLGALLYPTMKIIRGRSSQIILLSILGLCLIPLVGFVALKRMVLVKWLQKISGFHLGFALALFFDIFRITYLVLPIASFFSGSCTPG